MSFNVRNYIKNKVKEYNPNLDVRDGSVISDILIAPISLILEKYEETQNSILTKLSLSDVESMSEEEMDNVGKFYLIDRLIGNKSTGNIYLYFTSPVAINIPKGTSFTTTGGLVFDTVRDFYISRFIMEQNLDEYPYYVAGPISVISTKEGDAYNVPEGTSFSSSLNLSSTPSKTVNKDAFNGGSAKESNTQMYNRIINSLDGMSLSSPSAIKSLIQTYAPNINLVDVVGAGSPYMFRDLITDISSLNSYKSYDYLYAYSGLHTSKYDNPHAAYAGIFADIDPSSDVSFPSIATWSNEFSDTLYKGLFYKDDPNYAETSKNVLINDFILGSGWNEDIGFILTEGGWKVNDSISADNKVFDVDEIAPISTGVRLGKSKEIGADTSKLNLKIPFAAFQTVMKDLSDAQQKNDIARIQALTEVLNSYMQIENINNFSPIIHKQIPQHLGIGIECNMTTSDGTENGEMSYITILRNSSIHVAHDGYGLAWRKQPAYLIRMQKNNYSGEMSGFLQSDLYRFYNEYHVDGTQYLGHIKEHPEFWKYNVYLVDNDVLQEETWVGYDQMFDNTSGKNQFLQAAKVWIEPNISYDFRMYIYEAFGFEAWVGESKLAFNENNRVLYRGQSYPTYLPVSGDKTINAVDGKLISISDRNHFGIGVGQTRNYEWTVNNLKVWSITESFAMHLFQFKMDTTVFNSAAKFNLNYYGVGFDQQLITNGIEGNRSKLKLGIYNFFSDSWETLGTNTIDPTTMLYVDDCKMSYTLEPLSNYLDLSNNLYVAAAAANSGEDYVNNKNHTLRSYYIEVNNGADIRAHRGNCTDIYCYDPSNIKMGSVITTLQGDRLRTKDLPGVHSHIQEILGIREYFSQQEVSSSTYVINNLDDGSTYSDSANYEVVFDSTDMEGMIVEIYYRYWTRGDEIENELITSNRRYPNADYKIKVSPAVVVNISNLEYSGGLDSNKMRTVVKNYINSLSPQRLDKSDLVNLLYDNGANYVNLNISITLRKYDLFMKKTIKNMTEQYYELEGNSIAKFYTDETELLGVNKL